MAKAYVISPSSTKKKTFKPIGERFTLLEISDYLGSVVEPLFLGDWWIFVSKNIDGLDYNKHISNMLGIKVYGECVFIPEDELECAFFFPKEVLNDIAMEIVKNNISGVESMYKQFLGQMSENPNDPLMSGIQKEEIFKKHEAEVWNRFYNLLFTSDDYDVIEKNYKMLNNGREVDTFSKLEILSKMVDYFTVEQEFEKCQKIEKYKEYLKFNKYN